MTLNSQIEGFSPIPYHLPQSTAEGGCYAETCASIACMMLCERLLSHTPTGRARDNLELCLLNAVLGGASLDGKFFAYANKLATSGQETAFRDEWFVTCCCPPNLARTMGMLGGYTWAARVNEEAKKLELDVYLYLSATREIDLGAGGEKASVKMESGMPWKGETTWEFSAPEGWEWDIKIPAPGYAADIEVGLRASSPTHTPERAGLSTHHRLVGLLGDPPPRHIIPHPIILPPGPSPLAPPQHQPRHPHDLPRPDHLRRRIHRQPVPRHRPPAL